MAGRSRMQRGRKRKREVIPSDEENSNNNNNNSDNRTVSDDETESEEPQNQEKYTNFLEKHTQLAKRARKIRKRHKNKWLKNNNPQERCDTRIALRDLDNKLSNEIDSLRDPLSHKLLEYTVEINELNTLVNHPNEAAKEAEIEKKLTEVVYDQAKSLANEQMTISTLDFMNALTNKYTIDDSLNLLELSKDICDVISILPPINSLRCVLTNDLLTNNDDDQLSNNKKIKKKRNGVKLRNRHNDVSGEVHKPKQVIDESESLKDKTTKRVINVRKQIRKKVGFHIDCEQRPINLIETLHNSQSFSKTVENWFDFSFVIREGHCSTAIDQDTKQPMVQYIPPAVAQKKKELHEEQTGEKLGTGQSIVKFDMNTWMNITQAYKLRNKPPQIIGDKVVDIDENEDGNDKQKKKNRKK